MSDAADAHDVHRRDLRDHGLRPGAGERRRRRRPGWSSTAGASATSSAAPGRRAGEATFETLNPATGKPLAELAQATAGGRRRARCAAARKALAGLGGARRPRRARATSTRSRARSRSTARLFAVLETLDNGKPIRETRDIDIPLVARHFYHHAGWAQLHGRASSPATQPVGVVGQIIPWNFPLLMLAWKIAPALAAGNTVVLKPAEFTPLTALLFAEICARGRAAAGRRQHRHRRRRDRRGARRPSRTSTRSPSPARPRSAASSARRPPARGKKLSLELGGKSPFIVFDDADLDSAVEGVVDAIWFNQGQVCCAGSRLLVQEGIAERLRRQAARAHGEAARRRPARQGDRHRRDRRAGAARAHPAAGATGRGRRRDAAGSRPGRCPTRRLLLSADAVHRRRAGRRPSRRSRSSARCWSR